jgi:anti-sigma-K factor RskA
MNWLRRNKRGGRVSLEKTEGTLACRLAAQAAREASHRLEETRSLTPEVRRWSEKLRKLREDNHFAESIRAAVLGEET